MYKMTLFYQKNDLIPRNRYFQMAFCSYLLEARKYKPIKLLLKHEKDAKYSVCSFFVLYYFPQERLGRTP